MNDMAPRLEPPVIAQTGNCEDWPNLDIRKQMPTDQFERVFQAADIIVAHAGIGTILSAKKYQKPLIIVPRRASFEEHRNDHQLATARQMETRQGVNVAWQTSDIERFLLADELVPLDPAPGPSHAGLVSSIRSFIA